MKPTKKKNQRAAKPGSTKAVRPAEAKLIQSLTDAILESVAGGTGGKVRDRC